MLNNCLRASGLLLGILPVLVSSPLPAQQVQRIPAEQAQLSVLREVQISTEVTGKLVFVNPQEAGRLVKQDELLVRVNDAHIQAEVTTAKRRAETMVEIDFAKTSKASAEQRLKTMQDANRKAAGVYNENEMRTIQLEVDKAVAQLAKAEEDKVIYSLTTNEKMALLNQYNVTAPFDGIVTKVHKFPAVNVRPGDPVLTLTDMSILRAFVKVNFIHRDALFVGDEVEFRINTAAKPGVSENATPTVRPTSDAGAEGFFNNNGPNSEPFVAAFVPAADPIAFDEPQTFIGTIGFVDPKVEPLTGAGNSTYAVTLSVDLPNPRDKHGRYLLQEGIPVIATILAKPRTE